MFYKILEYLKDIISIVYSLILIYKELQKDKKNKHREKKALTRRKGKKLS